MTQNIVPPPDSSRLFAFTRALMDVDSTTGREAPAARLVAQHLRALPGLEVEEWPLEGEDPALRLNLFARCGEPRVVLSTHLDTVPPFIPSREDDTHIHGRGACDAKGIIAAHVFAAETLLARGCRNFGLLFVAGEERNSAGALSANRRSPSSVRYLINGEPTESKMISAGKGVLRFTLRARGRAAHSAYPELGDSAIEKLLEALARVRALPWPSDPELGPTTLNIGTIHGGRAPNVIPDQAEAELFIRLVGPAAPLREIISHAVAGWADVEFVLEMPPLRLHTLDGFPTGIVAFGTDIPNLPAWGVPLLYGPGSIHVAHTPHECIAKAELVAAVEAYARMVERLSQENP